MKRRHFLSTVATAAVATAALPTPALSNNTKHLDMVTTWPENLPGIGISPFRIAGKIREATDGALNLRVHSAGQLVPAFESFDAVSSGRADAYHAAEFYWQEKSKAYALFTSVPFGMTASELNSWIYHGGGQKLWDELSARYNLKPFLSGNSGAQGCGWFKDEIRTTEDLRGLRMRMPGLGGDVVTRLGVKAVTIPGGDLYSALESGRVDAVDWAGPWSDLALKFYQVAKYYYWPGFQEPCAGLCTVFNMDVWNGLTSSEQRIVREVCASENDFTYTEILYNNALALDTLVSQHGVKLRIFPDEVLVAFRVATAQVMEELTSSDEFVAKVYDSYRLSLRATSEGLRDTELAYLNRR